MDIPPATDFLSNMDAIRRVLNIPPGMEMPKPTAEQEEQLRIERAKVAAYSERTFKQASPAAKRLLWTLNGPLESAIRVAEDQYYAPGDATEPYFRPAAADLAPSWHPVSQESLMDPGVSTITVRVSCFDAWEQLWHELHYDCPDVQGGPGLPRFKDAKLEVTASGPFVTIHEYVSAVHPWVMGMRERILETLGKVQLNPPLPPETKLAIQYLGPGPLSIDTEERLVELKMYEARRRNPERFPLSEFEKELARLPPKERMLARSAARIRELERLRQENK